jgi:transcriptional regulator with XRE-family HTH domain
MNLHTRIRHRRRQLGLSMHDVAAACNVTWQAVQRWETHASPQRDNLFKLVKILNVTIDWLTTGHDKTVIQNTSGVLKLSKVEAQLIMHFRLMNEQERENIVLQVNRLSQKCIDEFGGVLLKTKETSRVLKSSKKNY